MLHCSTFLHVHVFCHSSPSPILSVYKLAAGRYEICLWNVQVLEVHEKWLSNTHLVHSVFNCDSTNVADLSIQQQPNTGCIEDLKHLNLARHLGQEESNMEKIPNIYSENKPHNLKGQQCLNIHASVSDRLIIDRHWHPYDHIQMRRTRK